MDSPSLSDQRDSGLWHLALRDRHVAAGARFAPFAGWEMPLQYQGIVKEHEAVRARAGVFDVSHLGRCFVTGPGSGQLLRSVTTYDVLSMAPGTAHYSLYCNHDGGIDDDVFVYRLGIDEWLVAHNAANADSDYRRVAAVLGDGAAERTDETVMLAVQGPEALAMLARIVNSAVLSMAEHECRSFPWRGGSVLVARTGYTGEDGGECIIESSFAGALWDELLGAGAQPAGLGARDTLRLEAALPLHGHDIDASTSPYEAGLGWAVSLKDGADFTGRAALIRLKAQPPERRLTCLATLERSVLRTGYAVRLADGLPVATLTSGAFSPTVRRGIGMAYLAPTLTVPGTRLSVEIRGSPVPAEVVPRPFYKRS